MKRRYFPFQGDHFGMGRYEGESTQSCEARFSPSHSPFPGTQIVVGCGDVFRYWWGDGCCGIDCVTLSRFLFLRPQANLAFPPSYPA